MNIPLAGLPIRVTSSSPILMAEIADGKYQLSAESGVEIYKAGHLVCNANEPIDIAETLNQHLTGVIRGADTRSDGTLDLTLESDVRISFLPDHDFESWWVVGTDGFRVVCMPGGDLAVWPDD